MLACFPALQTASLDGYSFQQLEKDQFSFQATALSRVQVKVSSVDFHRRMDDRIPSLLHSSMTVHLCIQLVNCWIDVTSHKCSICAFLSLHMIIYLNFRIPLNYNDFNTSLFSAETEYCCTPSLHFLLLLLCVACTQVVDAEGNPLQGALVSLSGTNFRSNSLTNSSGELTFTDLV